MHISPSTRHTHTDSALVPVNAAILITDLGLSHYCVFESLVQSYTESLIVICLDVYISR